MELGSVALKNKHSTAVINTQHTPSSRVRGAPANDPYRQVRKGRSGIKTQHVVTGDAGERNHTSVASVAGRRRRSAESARTACPRRWVGSRGGCALRGVRTAQICGTNNLRFSTARMAHYGTDFWHYGGTLPEILSNF